jgi:uncharacterized membrane protein
MLKFLAAYGATLLVFLAMDMTWLTLASSIFYRPVIGPLLADKTDLGSAIVFYLIYIFGLIFFAVRPAVATGDWKTAAGSGLLMALVAYGTYDLTNAATLKLWSIKLTLADMCWGMTASAVASSIGFFVAKAVGGARS